MSEMENPVYFPMFINLQGRSILFAGAGMVAARRVSALMGFGADITVVAPAGCRQMEELTQQGEIVWKHREFAMADLEGCDIVFAATDNDALNTAIAAACKAKKIPVNHAGDRQQSDFYFPGIAREGAVVAGVCASGSNHRLAAAVTRKMQQWLAQVCKEERI